MTTPETPPIDAKPVNRGLWILVIGLGIAILVVVAAMIGMAIKNVVTKKTDAPTNTGAAITSVPGEVPQLALDLPPGATVSETRIEGATLLVRVSSPTGDEIFVIDSRAAKLIARIKLNKPQSGTTPP